jgi:ATP-dependent Clp endopeptidase proteolytic subunit ClpP
MSDAPSTLHPSEIARNKAEAAKLRAEAEQATALTRKLEAEARTAESVARKNEHSEKMARSMDEHHRVYRYNSAINNVTVTACITQLTAWSRLDPGCSMEIVFTSPGGSIIDGFVLYDFVRGLSKQGHHITTGCLGIAASMAGILLQMGDHRWVGSEGWVMIHRAAFGASGKTFEVEDEVEWVKRVERRILDLFVQRTNGRLSAAKIKRNWDRKDWWITSDEALELGLVDEVR